MKLYTSLRDIKGVETPKTVVTWGMFDGVHIGHAAILKKLQKSASALGARSLVVTFQAHPKWILTDNRFPLITSFEKRLSLMAGLGIDICLALPFDRKFANLSADEFLDDIVLAKLHSAGIVIGQGATFGRNCCGTTSVIGEFAERHGISFSLVKPVMRKGKPISSTRIRERLARHDFPAVNSMLGRPYSLDGYVVKGDQRGRVLGFRTANIFPAPDIIPPSGVYAVTTCVSGMAYKAVASIGHRPTFYDCKNKVVVEVHLIDYQGKLYGKRLDIIFQRYLRDQVRFEDEGALVKQISFDIRRARMLKNPVFE